MKKIAVCVALLFLVLLPSALWVKKNLLKNQATDMLSQHQIAMLEEIFGIQPELFPDEGVAKISIPHTDLKVTINDYTLSPFQGLTTWVAYKKGKKKGIEVMIMGDIVLLEHEVDSALGAAFDGNIEVTALHNHFLHDQPKIYFMHINAEGLTATIASNVKHIIDAIKNAKKYPTPYSITGNAITGSLVEQITGIKGQAKDGMFKLVVGRTVKTGCGCTVGKNMGVNTWASFGGTDDNAIVDGDFVVLEDELQPVLKALNNAAISIVAIHNHMTHEHPRCIFIHYWGHGTTKQLSHGIKNALRKTATPC